MCGSSCNTGICCGIHENLVQDCVECRWVIYDQTPQVIYQSSEIVSASGSIEQSSSTAGMTQVTMTFSIGETVIKNFTLTNRQCLAFTVIGFDTITLHGNGVSPLESASGRLCITPRYPAF
ncbi:S-Ena type endospore appendage [Ferviditalea candida]|uniref:S-Ena type endospore appendage n=1 Tax=Ferviditalea candida TaxID=3108399 RepID=A0ABU5ZLP8_9BACL|nr:S-Ena type endospore appendage [Paenibacillaceae bacterium T2]